MKCNPDGIDIEQVSRLEYKGVQFHLSSKLNPGTDMLEEYTIWLKSNETGELSKLTLNKGCHPHDSIGVFVEHSDGTVEKLPNSCDVKSSYFRQTEMVQDTLTKLVAGEDITHPYQYSTIEYQIYLHSVFDTVKANKNNGLVGLMGRL